MIRCKKHDVQTNRKEEEQEKAEAECIVWNPASCDPKTMIVHRLLDVVFRTLDTVDAVRERVDQVLRRDQQPPSSWPATPEEAGAERSRDVVDGEKVNDGYADRPDVDTWRATKATKATKATMAKKAQAQPAPAKEAKANAAKTAADGAKKKKASAAAARPRPKKKAAPKADASASRKGSVDRLGKDFDSPRANKTASFIAANQRPVVDDELAVDGKKTLARVLWAMAMAESAGVDEGLTAADVSALLSQAANLEVFSTNVGRSLRDESELFAETSPDGRSKRYALAKAGRERSKGLGFLD